MDIESRAPRPVQGETIAQSLNVVREENKLLKEKIRRLITIAPQTSREPSLDVCRGFATAMMIIVKHVGKSVPVVDYAPWDGIHFADFGPPVFLFLAGVSTALATAHGSHRSRLSATGVAFRRSAWLFGLGILLEGGFLNRENMSFGVDTAEFRAFGTLQRIAVAYFCTSLCEIWAPGYRDSQGVFSKKWYLHCAMTALIPAASAAILYGLHVPDWSFPLKSSVCRENLLRHREAPDWCSAPFESEGILSTMSATATSLIGLHFGHAMVRSKQHLARLWSWTLPSASLVIVGMTLHNLGLSFNRQLYSFSYMCFTAGTAGTLLSSVYFLVDASGWKSPFSELLELIGRHSLLLFALLQCDVLQTLLQGFYHKCPQNNIFSYLRNHHQVLHRILPWLRGL